jgi:polysaccharide export outer membrane protein
MHCVALRQSLRLHLPSPVGLLMARLTLVLLSLCSCSTGEAWGQGSDYLIGPQDVLRVTVWGQDALSGQFPVETDGTFSYPLLGRIPAGGLTLRAVETDLKTRLAQGFLTNPQVTVAVELYRSKRIFVVGEVRQPGTYPLSGEMSLIEALARAGSTTTEAGQEVLIVRARPGAKATGPVLGEKLDESAVTVHIDLHQLQEGAMSQNVALQDGDTVFVPRAETIYVFGQVRSPGAYALRRDTTVVQALALAGGVTERGATGRIQIIRFDKGERREIHARLDDMVQPRDTIVVPERYF